MDTTNYQSSSKNHMLAIMSLDRNIATWFEENNFRYLSRTPRLHENVGEGGTLWIIVSIPKPTGGRSYSLLYCLKNCKLEKYPKSTNYGHYAVVGDPSKSIQFSPNDASLLLLGSRFDPIRPIVDQHKIGQSLQMPRRLNHNDVQLFENFAKEHEPWSVFISYKRTDQVLAEEIYHVLKMSGIKVFWDKDSLRTGEIFGGKIAKAIGECKYFIILLGENTHTSNWVKDELQIAIDNNKLLVPIFMGANLEDWEEYPKLLNSHGHTVNDDKTSFLDKLISDLEAQ